MYRSFLNSEVSFLLSEIFGNVTRRLLSRLRNPED